MNTIWLAGATGLVGRECLEALLADPTVGSVVAVGRRAPDTAHAKLRWQNTTDFKDLAGALEADRPVAVLCALGTTIKRAGSQAAFREVDFEYPRRLALTAHAAGVEVFSVVTAVGADARSGVFYNRVKGEVEEALRAIGFPTTHVLHPSLLLGRRAESRPAERFAIASAPLFAPFCTGRWAKYRPRAAANGGRALARTGSDRRPGFWVHEGEALFRLASD
jgi:uncharacterized protein YbjT (DUF2867 family)